MTNPAPVKAENAAFITLGIPLERGHVQMKRAVELLKRHGFQAGITSEDAVLAAATQIDMDRAIEAREGEQ